MLIIKWRRKIGYGQPKQEDTKEYKLRKNILVNTFLIQEDITKGQRIEDFTIEVFTNGAWRHVGEEELRWDINVLLPFLG